MYEIEEFYKEDGYELEDVLKTCIMNYYNKYLAQFNNWVLNKLKNNGIITNEISKFVSLFLV